MKLFNYQAEASQWLAEKKRALLNFQMGTGKTPISIAAANLAQIKTAIIVCPAIAIPNWERELQKWGAKFHYKIFSYAKLPEPYFTNLLILDESHYLKEPTAQRTVKVFGKFGLIRQAERAWCLTGTPCPNHYAEIWPMAYTFGLTDLKYEDFVRRYCHVKQFKHHWRVSRSRPEMANDLWSRLSPITLKKTAEEVGLELPPLFITTTFINPGTVEREALGAKQTWEKLFAQRDRLLNFLKGRSENISQISDSISTLRKFLGLQKVSPAIELLKNELDSDPEAKVVVFAHHREVIDQLALGLTEFGVSKIYGDTTGSKRQDLIDKFQNKKSQRVFIGNIQSTGTAITLTSSTNVVFVESSFTPADNAQALKRCHRIGQTKPVFVRFLSLNDSLDEKITAIVERKTREISTLFSSK